MCDASYVISLPEVEDFSSMEQPLAPEPQVRLNSTKSTMRISDGTHVTGAKLHYVNSKVSPLTPSQEVTARETPDLQAVVRQIQQKERAPGEYTSISVALSKNQKHRKSESARIKREKLGNKGRHTRKKTGENLAA